MHFAADPAIDTEITTSLITQGGILLGIIVTGIFSILASIRAKRTEQHSAKAAEDSAVVRAETRNAHNPNQPMRHDMDQILANQQNAQLAQEAFQAQVLSKLEGHDKEFQGLRSDGVEQWKAINSALSMATQVSQAASATVRAAERTVTEAVKIVKE